MAVTTAAGTSIHIGTTAANPTADTYKRIAEVVNIPTFGKQYQEVTHQPLDSRETQKFKGSFNAGNIEIQFGMDVEDDGQAALLAALDSDDKYNFKIVYPSGHIRHFKAAVMSYNENPSGTNNIVSGTSNLSISGAITRTAPTP